MTRKTLEERLASLLGKPLDKIVPVKIFRNRAKDLVNIIDAQAGEIDLLKKELRAFEDETHEEIKALKHENNRYDYVHRIAKIIMASLVVCCILLAEYWMIEHKVLIYIMSALIWIFSVNTITYYIESIMHLVHSGKRL